MKAMMLKNYKSFIILLIALSGLSACSSWMKQTLGLTRISPDEFTVISHPPLQTPTSFALVKPQPKSVTSARSDQQNRQIIFKNDNPTKNPFKYDEQFRQTNKYQTKADNFLKEELDVSPEDSEVRELINKENEERLANNTGKTFLQKLMTLSGDEIEQDPVINPVLERQRILQEQRQGGVISGYDAETKNPSDDDRGLFNKMLGF